MAEEVKEVTFESLIGEHLFEGCDLFDTHVASWDGGPMESANAIRFQLDGVVYVAVEDPDDGYRSSMKSLTLSTEPAENLFSGQRVLVRQASSLKFQVDDCLEFIDTVTGKQVLKVGTSNTDDYYPSFVANFTPENMAINNMPKYEG